MTVVVFDLDDTLYDEITFVQSGLHAVSKLLALNHGLDAHSLYFYMREELTRNGRGQIFDSVLHENGIYSRKNVTFCLQVYRRHLPTIELFEDAKRFLDRARPASIYIVTDGNKLVQHRKLEALGLYRHSAIKKVYISRRFGIHNEKPSPYCFKQICELEGVASHQVVYIGDNPAKDFVGIRPLGFRTVRIMRGNHKYVEQKSHYEAEYRIDTLDELQSILDAIDES